MLLLMNSNILELFSSFNDSGYPHTGKTGKPREPTDREKQGNSGYPPTRRNREAQGTHRQGETGKLRVPTDKEKQGNSGYPPTRRNREAHGTHRQGETGKFAFKKTGGQDIMGTCIL